MIIWQANLGRGVPITEYRRNLRAVLAAAGPRALIGWQEIDEADLPNEMDDLIRLTQHTHKIVGTETTSPIAVPLHLPIIEQQITPACKGLALFTIPRPIVEVVVEVGPNLTFAALDLHVPIDRPETQGLRADAVAKLQERAAARKAQGHAGVWISDTNHRTGWPRIVHGERTVTDAGIDKAKAWASPGRRVVVTDRQTVPLTIDGHDAHGARVMVEPRDRCPA